MHSTAGVQNAATLADRGNGVHTFRAEKETSRSDVVHTWQQRVQSTSPTPSPVNKRQQGHHTSHEPEPTNYHTTYRVLRNKNVIHLFFHTSSMVFGQVLQKFYVNVRKWIGQLMEIWCNQLFFVLQCNYKMQGHANLQCWRAQSVHLWRVKYEHQWLTTDSAIKQWRKRLTACIAVDT